MKAIVNCAIGDTYLVLQERLILRCQEHCPDVKHLFFDDYPEGCPPHAERQYAFKIYALRAAIAAGADEVIWMDCTFQPRADIERLWQHIESVGWYVQKQGDATLAEWCCDSALEIFGVTRTQALDIPMVLSGLVGLDLKSRVGAQIWDKWQRSYEAGAFDGPHLNIPGEEHAEWGNKFSGHCSDDPVVNGHRHDEAALSWVVWSMGLDLPTATEFTTIERAAEVAFIERNF